MKTQSHIRKFIAVSVVFVLLSMHVFAQQTRAGGGYYYNTAIGVRGGWTSGLTVKHFIGESTAIEGILSGYPFGASITGLIEKHQPVFNEYGFQVYYGVGGHVRFYPWYYDRVYYNYGNRWYYDRVYTGGGARVGVDGILGLEYKIPDFPLAFSLDIKPFVEAGGGGVVIFVPDGGLGIKVAF